MTHDNDDVFEPHKHDLTKLPQLEIRTKLKILRQQHHDLEKRIVALLEQKQINAIELQRLKKEKLKIKDQIKQLENHLLPDIIA